MADLRDARILIVDDEPDLRDMVACEFALQGSKVFEADSGRGALGIVQSENVDAVITDIRMADCSGIELLRHLRLRHEGDPVVIFITAYECDLPPLEAYSQGAEGIFAKPFCLKDLVECVQKALVPPEKRWSTPPARQPGQVIERDLPDLDATRRGRLLALGRGGMAIALTDIRVAQDEPLSFNLRLAGGPVPIIEGAGIVRWVRQAAENCGRICGVEFEYLTDAARGPVLRWIKANRCTAFIPRL
jgi:DNA-binding response OmpR family regulator